MNILLVTLMTLSGLLAALFTYFLFHPRTRLPILALPNARSLHTQPTPTTGGVAILISFIISLLVSILFFELEISITFAWISLGASLIAIISFIDDWHPLPASLRLIAHFIATLSILWQTDLWVNMFELPANIINLPEPLIAATSFLFIIWMINLYNFMDGMDGFAGGMGVCGFSAFAIMGLLAGHEEFTFINFLLASAIFGFLIFNFPPARIFMGDVGASTLGFLAAFFSIWGTRESIFPLWIAILVFLPFSIDATVTLCRRILNAEKIWQPHRSHYYQRLVKLGWGHERTVLYEYVLMLGCAFSAILALYLPPYAQWAVIGSWLILYAILMWFVHRLEQHQPKKTI